MMKNILICLLALGGVADLTVLGLSRMLQPLGAQEVLIQRISGVCVVLLLAIAAGAFVDPRRFSLEPQRWLIILLIATFAVTLAPHLAYRAKAANEMAQSKAEQLEVLRKFEREKIDLEKDLLGRVASRRQYTAGEALEFLNVIRNWDLGYRGLPDHSEEGLALLRRAIDDKLLDPSIEVDTGEPLWLAYSKPAEDLARTTHTEIPSTEARIIMILKGRH